MGYAPLHDTSDLNNGYLESVVEGIPAMKGIRLRDIPSFIRSTNLDDFMIRFIFTETKRAKRSSAIILNTFEALELNVLDALNTFLPPTYAVVPLHLLKTELDDDRLDRVSSNLWKENPECLEWLDSQEPNPISRLREFR